MKVSENLLLTHTVLARTNGGNVHRSRALVAAYQSALDVAQDGRTLNRREAAAGVARCEQALREFVGGR